MFYLSGRMDRTDTDREVTMYEIRQQCIEFAASHPTPNVRLAVQYAHSGAITWEQCYGLFAKAMGDALAAVR